MRNFLYANALLKDGKIMFWWTGDECHDETDFYKDFFYAGLNMSEELENHNYELKKARLGDRRRDNFEKDAEFYKQFPLHEDFVGNRPY